MKVDISEYMRVNNWGIMYPAYLDTNWESTDTPNPECPFVQGDIVFRNPNEYYEEKGGVGVVLGVICLDGEMRLDLCGMTVWSECRLATVEEIAACPFFDKIQEALILDVPKKYKRFFHYWNNFYLIHHFQNGYKIEYVKGRFCPNWSIHLTKREGDKLVGDSVVASGMRLKKDTLEIVQIINDFIKLSSKNLTFFSQ